MKRPPVLSGLFSICLFGLILSGQLLGNALTITNLDRDSLAQTVSFEIQWNNSWRLDSTAAPLNWDAAWVFVKFLPCNASPSISWSHGQLSTTLADHSFDDLEPVLADGSAVGLDSDALGVMLRRNRNGLFPNAPASTITLHVTNMLPNEAYHLRVVGIEMVFVPEDTFAVGGLTYSNAFSQTPTVTDPTPLTINSEAAQTITSHASGVNASVSLSAAFPKGFAAFHIMKYEISQGQYATFLNSIAVAYQTNRYPNQLGNNRNRVQGSGNNSLNLYYADRPDRACNYLSWDDLMAYLDWAALRPMSELEFEKACRGRDTVVTDEYAWGTTNLFEVITLTSPEDGAEIPGNLPANANYLNNNFTGGDGGRGPVRAGLFALPTNSTREQSGATYYGIMEMSGNVSEACVRVEDGTATTGTINFTRNWGDGVLSATQMANTPGWPAIGDAGISIRGGDWNDGSAFLRTADRSPGWAGGRDQAIGGRGVR
jgi:formylglycine-generating enzyme required for sulfatase activity